jgi:hypothetical protein
MRKMMKRAAPIIAVAALGAVWMTVRTSGQTTGMPSTKNGD